MEHVRRSRSAQNSDLPTTAKIQKSSWGTPSVDQLQQQPVFYDFSHVDLFSHAPPDRRTPPLLPTIQPSPNPDSLEISQAPQVIQRAIWHGVIHGGQQKWQAKIGGKIKRKDADEVNYAWEKGATWNDQTDAYLTADQVEQAKKSQLKAAAVKREQKLAREKEINKKRRIPQRAKSKYDAQAEAAEQARQEAAKAGKAPLHRGSSFTDGSKAISALMEEFTNQLKDQTLNTTSADYKLELITLANSTDRTKLVFKAASHGAVQAAGWLDFNADKVSKDPPEPHGHARSSTQDKGHLITESLVAEDRRGQTGGVNDARNIIGEQWNINQRYKRGIELAVESVLADSDNSVFQVSTVNYNDDNTAPNSVVHHYIVRNQLTGETKVVSFELMNTHEVPRM